jgi:tRNA (guanosine-2'-O-)-methyltransferase
MLRKCIYFASGMKEELKRELSHLLRGFVAEKRLERFEQVLSERTSHLRIVLENVFQAHNASAVLRSCEAFGIQHVHFIENNNKMRVSDEVAMGSSKWLTIHKHKESEHNSVKTITELKKMGYKIIATTPHTNDVTIDKLPVNEKMALVFGTEIEGISKEIIDHADGFVKIPMYGFTESFNVSVCAALCMYELTGRIRRDVQDYRISEQEKTDICFEWLKTTVEFSDAIIARYLSEKKV